MSEFPINIGKLVKSWRAANRMTLKDLAEKSGLSVSYLSDIENERTLPSLDTLHAIARAFNSDLSIEFIPHQFAPRPTTKTFSLNDVTRLRNLAESILEVLDVAGVVGDEVRRKREGEAE